MDVQFFLSFSPKVEVVVRNLYWRLSIIHRFLSWLKSKQYKRVVETELEYDKELLPAILDELKSFGVNKDDLLIIHSSRLKNTGLTPEEICSEFIKLVGSNGTLAMPAIPFFREEPKGFDRMKDTICARRLVFDVKKTPPWTGVLPFTLMNFEGAVRSKHPLNTMVALGRYANQMMSLNIDGSLPKACGVNSSWKFCADNNAKIAFLDVDAAHCMTMIHVAEDSHQERGHAPGWYRERLFKIIDGDTEEDITVRERHPKWAMYYAERNFQKNLIDAGILKIKLVKGIRVAFCESNEVLNYIHSHKSPTYPFWIPFWKRRFLNE